MQSNEEPLAESKATEDTIPYWSLAEPYQQRLHRVALRLCVGNDEEARDLVLQTFAKTAACDGVGDHGDPWALFKRVMFNAFIDRIRLKKRETQIQENLTNANGNEEVDLRLKSLLIRQALSQIEPDQLRLVQLVYGEGNTLLEASVELGISEEAVKQRLKRIRSKIRTALPGVSEANEN